ncbi:M50 family metallopeptidase [Micrococcus terreus]|nr:site-2 protease family protein [Micrococcus terreus]
MMEILLFVLGVIVVAVGIAVSIALHEVGHLVPAKLFGVRVPQYMIGFGPTIWSRRRGETEYGFKAVPLGGYISMIGMYPPAEDGSVRSNRTGMFQQLADEAKAAEAERLQPGDEDRLFYRLPVWKRITIMLGGPLMNLILGTLLIGVVLTMFGTTQATTTVASVNQCVISAAEEQQRAGSAEQQDCEPEDPQAPAYAAGLRPGDVVTSFNGTDLAERDWLKLTGLIRATAGQESTLTFVRDGQEQTTQITPLLTQRPEVDELGLPVRDISGQLKMTEVGFIGMGSQQRFMTLPVTEVPGQVGQQVGAVARVVLDLPARMVAVVNAAFSDAPRDPNGPISVVGVGRLAGEISVHEEIPFQSKVASLISLVGGLNIALFVFNLIPLLPLDGGHVVGALWDGLKRAWATARGRPTPRPADISKALPLTYVVAGLLLVMGVLLIFADIVKPVSLF